MLARYNRPRFNLRIEKVTGNTVHIACRLHNYATVRKIQHTGTDKLLQMGYYLTEEKHDIVCPGTWHGIVYIQQEGITIDKILADCNAAGVASTIEYEWDSSFFENEYSGTAQLPWGKSIVRRELV